jgi:pimeloyl-ACP methyl ester carboxylesterase
VNRSIRRLAIWLGAALGALLFVLLVMVMIAPGDPPPPPASSLAHFQSIDFSDLPNLSTATARDGQALAYRFYPSPAGKVVLLLHGSAGSSASVHALATGLARHGAAVVYALDLRGHGASGPRGDVRYIGQLDDDLADLSAWIRARHPGQQLLLAGFSATGGLALRIAAGPQGRLFDGYVLLAPYLGPFAPTNRPGGGGWAQVSMPRILALTALSSLAIRKWEGLTVVRYAVNPAAPFPTTPSYSYRLARSIQAPLGLASAFARVSEPVTIIVGSSDEQMRPDQYTPLVQPRGNKVTVTIVPGSTHIGVITDALAVATVIDRVQHMP